MSVLTLKETDPFLSCAEVMRSISRSLSRDGWSRGNREAPPRHPESARAFHHRIKPKLLQPISFQYFSFTKFFTLIWEGERNRKLEEKPTCICHPRQPKVKSHLKSPGKATRLTPGFGTRRVAHLEGAAGLRHRGAWCPAAARSGLRPDRKNPRPMGAASPRPRIPRALPSAPAEPRLHGLPAGRELTFRGMDAVGSPLPLPSPSLLPGGLRRHPTFGMAGGINRF